MKRRATQRTSRPHNLASRVGAVAFVVVAAALFAGCSASDSDGAAPSDGGVPYAFETNEAAVAFANEHGYTLMASILADGTVTRDEYAESYQHYEACAEQAGFVFESDPAEWNPVDNLSLNRDVVTPPSSEGLERFEDCNLQHTYVANEFSNTETARTDPALLSYVFDCAEAGSARLDRDGVASIVGLVASNPALGADGGAIPGCVSDGMKALFPEVGSYALAF